MTDEEIAGVWTTLGPDDWQRRRMDARVSAWLEAHDTSIVAEWIGIFRAAPFSVAGLVAVSAVALVVATPVAWIARALLNG